MIDGLCKYYFLITLIFIFMAVFCSIFVSTYAGDTCVSEKTVTTSTPSATDPTVSDTVSKTVSEVLSLQLTKIPAIMVIMYSMEAACLILVMMFYIWFKTYLPRQFGKMGRIMKCIGILLKLLPKLVILLHYIILILIVVIIAQVANGQCATSTKIDGTGATTPTDMQKQGVVLVLILSILWILLHVGGWIVRSVISIDCFIIEPEDTQANRFIRMLCVRCGP